MDRKIGKGSVETFVEGSVRNRTCCPEVARREAFQYCRLLLKHRLRMKQEIKDRLQQKGFALDLIDKVISHLEKEKILNDELFIEVTVTSCIEHGWGRKKIAGHLEEKWGIGPERWEAVWRKNFAVYQEQMQRLIEKKREEYRDKNDWYVRILHYMRGRGFDDEEVMPHIGIAGQCQEPEL